MPASGASALLLSFVAHAQVYTVVDLGIPGGATGYSDPHALNRYGSVAGEWGGSFTVNAFAYQNATNTSIVPNGVAYSINNSNWVAGEAGAAFTHAFLYSNGMMSDLGTLPGASYSVAWAINDAGEVVGEGTISALPNAEDHAVWWHNGTATNLGVLPSGDYSSARGINSANEIVGEASVISGGVTNVFGFTYASGVMAQITNSGAFAGGNYGSARAINDPGQIAGEASLPGGDTHGFLLTGGVMQDLGAFGGNYSTATALNSSCQVVGYGLDAAGNARASLSFDAHTYDLNTLFSNALVCTNLISADGINAAGQIAGSGYTPGGDYHAFLLTPAIQLAAPLALTNGLWRITVVGPPGQSFLLETSTDLTNWMILQTNTLSGLSTNLVDSPGNTLRFYRAVAPR